MRCLQNRGRDLAETNLCCAGGLSASAGWQGRMKPGGLERVRIGREETRQSIRNEREGTPAPFDRLRLRSRTRRHEETPPDVEGPAGWRRGCIDFDAAEFSLPNSKKSFLTERLNFRFPCRLARPA